MDYVYSAGALYPTSMRINEQGRLVVNFRTEARFRGLFVAVHTGKISLLYTSSKYEILLMLLMFLFINTYYNKELFLPAANLRGLKTAGRIKRSYIAYGTNAKMFLLVELIKLTCYLSLWLPSILCEVHSVECRPPRLDL